MDTLKAPLEAVRSFWANDQSRRTLMWVIFALSLAVIAVGAFFTITNQIEYMHRSDDIDAIQKQIDAINAPYPKIEVDGQLKPDLRDATDEEQQMVAQLVMPLDTQRRRLANERVDSYNQRSTGIRIVGFGVIGLALAYLVKPEPKKPDADETAPDLPAPGSGT